MSPPTDPLQVVAVAAGFFIFLILLSIWLSRPIRRLVIFVAQVFCTLVVILTTGAGGMAAWFGTKSAYPIASEAVVILASVIGAFLGFVIAAFLTAFLYLLIEIAENSRRSGELPNVRPRI